MKTRSWMSLTMLLTVPALAQPADGPPAHAPPQAALDACSGKAEGAACTFDGRGRAVSGTCHAGPQGEPAACMPAHPAPPPEALAACQGLAEGASCKVALGDHALVGTCRAGPRGGEALACAPSGRHPARTP